MFCFDSLPVVRSMLNGSMGFSKSYCRRPFRQPVSYCYRSSIRTIWVSCEIAQEPIASRIIWPCQTVNRSGSRTSPRKATIEQPLKRIPMDPLFSENPRIRFEPVTVVAHEAVTERSGTGTSKAHWSTHSLAAIPSVKVRQFEQ